MIEIIAKLALGTLLFILIMYFAQSIRMRWAAGMLLTFPALNGIGLLIGSSKSVALASPMLPMIAVNGTICFLYVYFLERGREFVGRLGPAILFCGGLVVWLLAFAVNINASGWEIILLATYGAFAALVTYGLWEGRDRITQLPGSKSLWEFLLAWGIWGPRALIFFGLLALFAYLSYVGADSVAGRLGAAPLLPLFALWAIAASDESGVRMRTMKVTVFIGPIVAMSFVILFATTVYQADFGSGLIYLLVGWAFCFLCIMAIALALDAIDHRRKV